MAGGSQTSNLSGLRKTESSRREMFTSPLQDANGTPTTRNENNNSQQKSSPSTENNNNQNQQQQQPKIQPKSEAPDVIQYQNGVYLPNLEQQNSSNLVENMGNSHIGMIQPEIISSQNIPLVQPPPPPQIHLTPPIHPTQLAPPPIIDTHPGVPGVFLGMDAVQAAAVLAQRNVQLHPSWGTAANTQLLDSTLSR